MRLLGLALMLAGGLASGEEGKSRLDQTVLKDKSPLAASHGVILSYADTFDKVKDSVVTIEVQVRKEPLERDGKAERADDIFDLRPPPEEKHKDEDEEEYAGGNGSGIVLTEDGLVLTNNHVVDGAEGVRVRARNSETSLPARVIGRDPYTDVALLRVEQNAGWHPATMGDSSLIRVGDVALAIGTPFGLDQTLTCGVISATGRSHVRLMASGMEDFIQTDAAINPGNSGGPLMDALGRVGGVNTGKIGTDGIGLAVPVNLALKIASDLESEGRVVRGYLGARVIPLTRDLSKTLNLKAGVKGMVIEEVQAGSPAAVAGLLPKDVVIQIGSLRIDSRPRFYLALAMLRPLDEAVFRVVRASQIRELNVRLETPPSIEASGKLVTRELVHGVVLADLDERLRNRFNLRTGAEGIVVMQDFGMKNGKPLLNAGEIVLAVNGEDMLLLSDLPEGASLQGGPVMLRILGKAGERMVLVQDP